MKLFKLFFKFSIVGLSGVIVNFAVYSLLIYIGIYYIIAAVISFLFAVSNNFYWNFIWTFKGKGQEKSTRRKYIEFFTISLINFLVNIILLKFFHEGLGINEYLAQILAIGITSILNFIGNYLITFKDNPR